MGQCLLHPCKALLGCWLKVNQVVEGASKGILWDTQSI
jgi:hypothetical protein